MRRFGLWRPFFLLGGICRGAPHSRPHDSPRPQRGGLPVFGLTMFGLILAGARDRTLASPWIGWIGVVGALAWGLSAPLVILTDSEWAGILFPGIAVFALWLVLAAVWPLRARKPAS